MSDRPEWVTPEDFAVLARLNVRTIWDYRQRGKLPEPDTYVGRTPVWRRAVADWWVDQRKQEVAGR